MAFAMLNSHSGNSQTAKKQGQAGRPTTRKVVNMTSVQTELKQLTEDYAEAKADLDRMNEGQEPSSTTPFTTAVQRGYVNAHARALADFMLNNIDELTEDSKSIKARLGDSKPAFTYEQHDADCEIARQQARAIAELRHAFKFIRGIHDGEEWGASKYSIHLGDAAEGGSIDAVPAADYNMMFHHDSHMPGIHPKLADLLDGLGYYAEWHDPGTVIAYQV